MTRKMILVAALIFIIAIVAIFYIALRNTRTDVSKQVPYASWMGEEVLLQRQAFMIKNEKQFVIEAEYQLVDESVGGNAILLPAGTKVKLEAALHYRNGVSGVTHSLVIGTVQVSNELLKFEYYWGQFHAICLEPPCNYWTYPQAVWQSEADTAKYY